MKGIFSICLLLTTAVSASAQPVELNGIMGRSMTFRAAVEKDGSLMFKVDTIGDVTNRKFTPLGKEKSSGRLQWDGSSGFFSLSQLTIQDFGEYKVQNTDLNITTVFQLNVYVPLSKPSVNVSHNQYPCTLLCTVERGTEATLSWYRGGEEKPYVTSPVHSTPDLAMTVPVENGGTYTCEAKNSVSNKRSDPLTVGDHCTGTNVWLIVACVLGGLLLLLLGVFAVGIHLWRRDSSTGQKGVGTSEEEAARLKEGEKPSAESSS